MKEYLQRNVHGPAHVLCSGASLDIVTKIYLSSLHTFAMKTYNMFLAFSFLFLRFFTAYDLQRLRLLVGSFMDYCCRPRIFLKSCRQSKRKVVNNFTGRYDNARTPASKFNVSTIFAIMLVPSLL